MAYPKPLSEKTLAKQYKAANIDEETSDYLHRFFLAAANLYGVISLEDLWDVFKEFKCEYNQETPFVNRQTLFDFSTIVRREDVPYYVFEIDELYDDEERDDFSREIVLKDIVGVGSDKFDIYYDLSDNQWGKPFYITADFLSFENPAKTPAQSEFLKYLKKLKVTLEKSETLDGDEVVCKNVGKKLGEFSFMNFSERNTYETQKEAGGTQGKKIAEHIAKKTSVSEAEKIYNEYIFRVSNTMENPLEDIRLVMGELNEVGVALNESQLKKVLDFLFRVNNSSHTHNLRGWTPEDFPRPEVPAGSFPELIFGPGIQKMAEEGDLDINELRAHAKRQGFTVVDD